MNAKLFLTLTTAVVFSCYGALSCPKECSCHISNKTVEVVCHQPTMDRFPGESLPGNTTSLTIQYTNLSAITGHDLRAIPLLQELHLPGNKLSSLPEDLLMGLPHLHTLDLTGNQLKELPPRVFHHAPLLNLVLKDNLLTITHADWLPKNSNLTWLDLSGNSLRKAPVVLLQNLRHLVTLHLSQNQIEELPLGTLSPLSSLERLHLDENKLQSLDASAFSHSTNITHLFLQNNKLKSLPANVFHGLKRLEYLDISENALRFLAPGTLDTGVSSVELSLNLWHCDAEIEYLWDWLKRKADAADVKCASPESRRDRKIVTLTRTELGLTE
ncbi:leucine-rich alpha-2-glycoprotein [Chanos chanos]|uniref:Leucine-rich alpha-2-glycoprotein n=1 Tax=Chanos chanos TaxID=29144 RepID=A0A6J2V9A6_CHACN|nr:leucine-rich alpha-2-glycoprotein-like [Chanos chanos]